MNLEGALAIALGLLLDAAMGDPRWNLHPVRILGSLAAKAEGAALVLSRRVISRCGPSRCGLGRPGEPAPAVSQLPELTAPSGPRVPRLVMAGALAWLAVCCISAGAALGFVFLARALHPAAAVMAEALVVWASIAPSDLARHAYRVARGLDRDRRACRAEPEEGRRAVAMIVGRKVEALDYSGVSRACVESVAESSVDGAAAPLFWAALFGPWAAFLYRAVNTMDSMFGHKDARYYSFGLVAARADDVANWLPARISAIVACLAAPLAGGSAGGALRSFLRYRNRHASPNAGQPESAYAGAFGLRLGGPVLYAEGLIDKPWMNPSGRDAEAADIRRAVRLMAVQTVLSAAVFAAAAAALRTFIG